MAAGRTYERKVLKHLRKEFPNDIILYGPWFKFEDENGLGWANPDAVVVRPDSILVVEAKLTHCQDAIDQLVRLYAPLAERIFDRKVRLVEVCKFVAQPHICALKLEECWGSDHSMYHFLGL